MAVMADDLHDEETIRAVVDSYHSGEKVRSALDRLGIDASAYWAILEEHAKLPPRYRRAERLAGNRVQMAHLYDHIKRQDEYIQELQALLRKNKIRFPSKPTAGT